MTRADDMIRLVWPPVLITVILGALAAFSVSTQEAWVAPSLAPAVFSQLFHPNDTGSHAINIAIGQVIGVAAGMGAVAVWHRCARNRGAQQALRCLRETGNVGQADNARTQLTPMFTEDREWSRCLRPL